MMYQEKDNIELRRELTDAVKQEIVAFLNTMNGIIKPLNYNLIILILYGMV